MALRRLDVLRKTEMIRHVSSYSAYINVGCARVEGSRRQAVRTLPSSSSLHYTACVPKQIDVSILAKMVEDARRPGVRRVPQNDGAPYRATLRRSVRTLAANARLRDKQRGRQSEVDDGLLLDLIMDQGGLCAYSGVPMELTRPHSHWRMSIERKDTSQGYVRGNYCLIAAEFNSSVQGVDTGLGSSQWSKQKVGLVNSLRHQPVLLPRLRDDIQLASLRPKARSKISKPAGEFRGPDLDGKVRCVDCKIWKEQDQYYKAASNSIGLFSLCRKCYSQTRSAYDSTLRGHAQLMLKNARRRAFNAAITGTWRGTFMLELEDLLHMLWQQGGRCFYSGVPLHCSKGPADWAWSLERLDNSETYSRSNCVLIAREFNTSSQWSRSKAKHIWGPFTPNE